MAEQNTNPGIQALQKAGYTPEQIGQFGQMYSQRAIAMGYGQEVPKMYVPTQDDNASIIQEFSRSITNATLPALAKGITLIPQIAVNAAGFTPKALDEWTNDIISGIDKNYTGYVNPMHNRGMFEKNENGEWGITDARSILNGFGSGIGSLVTAMALGAATGTGAAGVVASASLMSLPDLWKTGQEAGLADVDNARMSLVLAPVIGGLELIGGLETGLLKSFEKEVVGELAEGAIVRGLKSAGLKESLELIGKNVPDEAMFKEAAAASLRKLSTWGAKFASGKAVKEGFGESSEEYLQNFVTKAGEQIYDTWFSKEGTMPGQGQYGTELFVPETDQRGIGPSMLGMKYNRDEFYDDLQSAIYGGILGHGMAALNTPVVNQSMYGYIDVAVKKGKADGAMQQMSGLIQQSVQQGTMTEEQGQQAMTTATNMIGLANMLKDTPVTLTPTLRYAVYDNQYNKIPKYNQVTQDFESAVQGLSAMLEDNMAGIAQVAALQDQVKRMYPEYRKSQLRTAATSNFIRSIVTKGEPTDLQRQLAEIDNMQFDIMEDDAFKDLMRGYMLALPQVGSESRGFEPPAGPPSVPPAGGTPPPMGGGGGAAPSATPPPAGGATPPLATPPSATPPSATPPSATPPTAPMPEKPVEESGQMAPTGKPQTWVQAMGAPVVFRGQEGTVVYDETDGYLFIPENTSNEVVITKDSSQNPADLGLEFSNTYNPITYAFQEQSTDESLLRPEQPEVELQQMGKGDQESQVATQEGKKEVKVSGDNVQMYGKSYKLISINKDPKGNPISAVLQNESGQTVTSNNQDLLLASLEQEDMNVLENRTNEQVNSAIEEVLNEDNPDGIPAHMAAFNSMIEAMPDEVAEVLDLMEKDYRGFPNELAGMISKAREWMDSMIYYVQNNPKFTAAQKAEIISQFDQFNQNLINYYYALGEEKLAREVEQSQPQQIQVETETITTDTGSAQAGVGQTQITPQLYEALGFKPSKDAVRLYRIENKNIPYDESREGVVSKKEIVGGFFTDNLNTVANYIRKNQSQEGINLVYVDISKADLDKYHVSKNEFARTMDVEFDNWIIPNSIKRNYISLESLPKVTGNLMTLSTAKTALKEIIDNLPTIQITNEEENKPMLEGLPDGRQQEEGGQEGAQLRPEAQEEILAVNKKTDVERLSNKNLTSPQGEVNTGKLEEAKLKNIDKVVARDDNGDLKLFVNADKLNKILLARNGKILFRAMQGRLFVIAKVGQFYIPFYKSSAGTSGKVQGAWYPFFGYNNWLVKGRVGKEGEMEYSKQIDDVAKLLNENLKLPQNKEGSSYLTQFGQIISGGTPANPKKVLYDINNDLGYESWFVDFDLKKGNKYTEEQFVADRTGLNPKNVINDGKGSADAWINNIIALTEDAEKASKGVISNSDINILQAQEEVLAPEAPAAIEEMQKDIQQELEPTQEIENEAEKIVTGQDREVEQGLDSLGASLESQGAVGGTQVGGVRQETVQQPGGEGQGVAGGQQIAEGQQQGQPTANRQDFVQTASEGEIGQAAPEIKERYDNSTKYVSVFDEDSTVEKTLPEGSKRRVKIILGEASAVTPSHSPFTFVSTPGFPKNEAGQNINTNDYSESKNIEAVTLIATNFDSRALDDMPFVKDGVVYSGNNRTMSRQLAATQGTDSAYIKALRQQAKRLGFTEEQINSLKSPFVWMEIQDDIKPTSEEYAKYNQSREKQQDPISEAVAMGKKVDQNTLRVLGQLMGEYETFNQFASSKDAADFLKGLIDIKLINYQMAMSLIDEAGRVNDKGKTFLRSMLLGNVLTEDNVRKFNEEGFLSFTNRIMNAISELSWNLGKGTYNILEDVNNALRIQKAIMDIQAKTPGSNYEGALQAYLNQRVIGEKMMDPNAILLNVLLNKGDRDFKKVMNEYIQKADAASKGTFDMFGGPSKVLSKEEIVADIMKAYMEGSKLTNIEKGVINSYAGFIKEQAAEGGKAVIKEVDNTAQADAVKANANNIANKYKKC